MREELERVLKLHGANIVSDPKANIDYILVGFKPGSKLEKAKVHKITELSFLKNYS